MAWTKDILIKKFYYVVLWGRLGICPKSNLESLEASFIVYPHIHTCIQTHTHNRTPGLPFPLRPHQLSLVLIPAASLVKAFPSSFPLCFTWSSGSSFPHTKSCFHIPEPDSLPYCHSLPWGVHLHAPLHKDDLPHYEDLPNIQDHPGAFWVPPDSSAPHSNHCSFWSQGSHSNLSHSSPTFGSN